jgi:hypothetical protein
MNRLLFLSVSVFIIVACEKVPDLPDPSQKIDGWISGVQSEEVVSGIVNFSVRVYTNSAFTDQVTDIRLYLDDDLYYEDQNHDGIDNFGYEIEWDTRELEDNSIHLFKLFGYDLDGNGFMKEAELTVIHDYFKPEDMVGTWRGDLIIPWPTREEIYLYIEVDENYSISGSGIYGHWTMDPVHNGKITGNGSCIRYEGNNIISGANIWNIRLGGNKTTISGTYDGCHLDAVVQLEKD